MKSPTVFFDLETGGLGAEHPDIQVAAIAVMNWEELEVFEAKIEFDVSKADPEALAINSYSAEGWAKAAQPEQMVVAGFGQFLRKHASIPKISQRGHPYLIARLAGHNASKFDAPRLLAMFQRRGAFLAADAFRPLDTLQLALWHFAGREDEPGDYKLGTLAQTLGIEESGAHDALADARTAMQIARILLEKENARPSGR